MSSSAPSVVIVLTTLGKDADASTFARALVDERLAACVNIVPGMTSIYRWKGSIEQDAEQLLIIKTTRPLLDALQARFKTLHPYELPEFLVLPVTGGSDGYLGWVGEAVARR